MNGSHGAVDISLEAVPGLGNLQCQSTESSTIVAAMNYPSMLQSHASDILKKPRVFADQETP